MLQHCKSYNYGAYNRSDAVKGSKAQRHKGSKELNNLPLSHYAVKPLRRFILPVQINESSLLLAVVFNIIPAESPYNIEVYPGTGNC